MNDRPSRRGALRRFSAALLAGSPLALDGNREARAAAMRPLPSFSSPTIAYHPSGPHTTARGVVTASERSIEADLRKLHAASFRGLVTYAALGGALGVAPQLARRAGFDGTVVMGIWDPGSAEEAAQALVQAPFVDAYCVGNEGLGTRYPRGLLAQRMAHLRAATGKPVTTSEPTDRYLAGPDAAWLQAESDWLFPIAHPSWAGLTDVGRAVAWIIARHDLLVAHARKGVVLKEAGLPSAGGAGFTPESQARFFDRLEEAKVSFVYFEAFDQPWKAAAVQHAAEGHWGLFTADGTPKPALLELQHRRKAP